MGSHSIRTDFLALRCYDRAADGFPFKALGVNCYYGAVADEGDLNRYARPHLDGLFGAHEMAKFGMIVDCARQMLYVNPRGFSAATSQTLVSFLEGRGFVRVPMHFNAQNHLEVDAAVNLRPVKLVVDTGAFTTLIAAPIAESSRLSTSKCRTRRRCDAPSASRTLSS